jgi:hypothetical protein
MHALSSFRARRLLCHLRASIVASGILGCSTSGDRQAPTRPGPGEQEGPVFYEAEGLEPNPAPMPSESGLGGFVDGQSPAAGGAINIDDACVNYQARAELVEQPVDIIFVLDNSGSMDEELAAVEANINLNFAAILLNSQVDYRVILISRHRSEAREDGNSASTSVCVSSPLSGLASCEDAEEPVFSERFYQYSTKIESDDSFDVLLDTYLPPFADDSREEKFDHAPLGWSEWLRPGAKKVFLEVTDDDEDMPATEFVKELTRLAPEHFGSDPEHPGFVFHSIVGLAEKDPPTAAYLPEDPLQDNECTGNDGDVTSNGATYQELSRLTGGLRFPLCQFDAYDVVFQRIAEDVVLTSALACDFDIPEPPSGFELDLNKVAISYLPGSGAAALQFGQAPSYEACQPEAFYIANGRLNLCPATCTAIRSDPLASVSVLFTCEDQIIIPR